MSEKRKTFILKLYKYDMSQIFIISTAREIQFEKCCSRTGVGNLLHLFLLLFISIFILLTRRKATEALIHRG